MAIQIEHFLKARVKFASIVPVSSSFGDGYCGGAETSVGELCGRSGDLGAVDCKRHFVRRFAGGVVLVGKVVGFVCGDIPLLSAQNDATAGMQGNVADVVVKGGGEEFAQPTGKGGIRFSLRLPFKHGSNRFVSFFMCNLNYHIVHHLYPGVPWYNLPALHRLLAEEQAAAGSQIYRSYTLFLADLGRFVFRALRAGDRVPLTQPRAS